MFAPYGTSLHQEPIVAYIGGNPFTHRKLDQIIFLVVYQRFKFETVRRIFELQNDFSITNKDVIEVIQKCGFASAICYRMKELWDVVSIDGVNLNQQMLDHIIFMALNRRFQYDTIKRFFYLSHNILISDRLIIQVLIQHDYAVRGPVHCKRTPMNHTVARVSAQGTGNWVRASREPNGRVQIETNRIFDEAQADSDAYSQYHSYNREIKSHFSNSSVIIPVTRYNTFDYVVGRYRDGRKRQSPQQLANSASPPTCLAPNTFVASAPPECRMDLKRTLDFQNMARELPY